MTNENEWVTESIQERIDGKRGSLCALLYANSRPRIAGYLALASAIRHAGHLCLVVYPRGSAPAPEETSGYEDLNIGCLDIPQLRRLRGIDVFFSSEVVSDVAPDECATVGIFHSLPEFLKLNYAEVINNQPGIVRSFDYLIVAMRQGARYWDTKNYERVVQNIYPSEHLKHRKPTLDIVPGGYPKLDYLEKLVSNDYPLDTIVYAPTRSLLKQGQMKEQAAIIIESLLETFKGHRVVFRPYPIEEDIVFGRQVASIFSSNPRFIFDETVTGLQHLHRCVVLVTDRSSVAVSFALATGRPIVLTDLPAETDVQRKIYGYVTKGRKGMMDAVTSCIEHHLEWRDSIFEGRQQVMYNPGTASAYLASKLSTFAARQSESDWLSIARTPWLGATDEVASKRHLDGLLERSKNGKLQSIYKTYTEIHQFLEENRVAS